MNILIVDDSNEKLANIATAIHSISEEFTIDTASDHISALRRIIENKYDLVIIDLLLPLRYGEQPSPDGGKNLLKEVNRNSNVKTPTFIIALTQYPEYKTNFSNIWPLLLYNYDDWEQTILQIVKHIEKSNKYITKKILPKPTIIVEGETDAKIILEAIKIFKPDYIEKIDIKFQKSAGANWVANQIVVWAHSLYKNSNGDLIKCVGLFDGDLAGEEAKKEINRIIKSDSANANTYKIFTLSPTYAKNIISLYQKGINLSITLEELYPPNIWKIAEQNNWLEDRNVTDDLLKDPKKWNKLSQTLKDYLLSLKLDEDEKRYLFKSFKMSKKENIEKYILNLNNTEKKLALSNFSKLIDDIINYFF